MKLFVFSTIFLFISLYNYSQIRTDIKRDTSLSMLKTFKLNSYKQYEKNTIKSLAFSLNFQNSTRFTLYHDTLNTKCILYDNYRQEYMNIDHPYPYSDIGSVLVGGTVYTLLDLLFRKR